MSTRSQKICGTVILLTWLAGCNLPGIPLLESTGPAPTAPAAVVCKANARTCTSGNTLQVCAPDGTDFDVRACGADESCTAGLCLPIESTCSAGQQFSFSTNALKFDVRGDDKSQTAALGIRNCSNREIIVEQAVVRAPNRPDGQPVFDLVDTFDARRRIPPGEELALRVGYHPAVGVAQAEGSLDLGISTDAYGRYSIPLGTRSWCTAATPNLRFGTLQEPDTRVIWFQNCGTQPVEVTAVDSDLIVSPLTKLPVTLQPMQDLAVEVFSGDELGPIAGAVLFKSDEALLARTAVQGLLADGECLARLEPPPDAVIHAPVRRTTTLFGAENVADLLDRPDQSYVVPSRRADVVALLPTIVGSYEVVARAVEDNMLSCQASTTRVVAAPDAAHLVELRWENIGDRIPDDPGPARGVNLDLHVVDRNVQTTGWTGAADCHVQNQACATGSMVSSSFSGDRPEAVALPNPATFDVGVHLANPFGYAGAQAHVRVFIDGELRADESRLLTTPNEFWLLGRWDASKREWIALNSVFDGLPR